MEDLAFLRHRSSFTASITSPVPLAINYSRASTECAKWGKECIRDIVERSRPVSGNVAKVARGVLRNVFRRLAEANDEIKA